MAKTGNLSVFALVLGVSTAAAQSPAPPPITSLAYGPAVTVEMAKKIADPAVAEARKNGWTVAVAIVDPAGILVYFERMDGTQNGSAQVAMEKARSAALFKRPTKAFQDAVAAGGEGIRLLRLEGAVPIEGGIPIVVEGKIIGAVGVSGATSAQDAQCAQAGLPK
jgi:uncharacterized protein GlcG (DUF336 family)